MAADRSIEDLARDVPRPVPPDPVAARLMVAVGDPRSRSAVLTFRCSRADADVIERLVEEARSAAGVTRGEALRALVERGSKPG